MSAGSAKQPETTVNGGVVVPRNMFGPYRPGVAESAGVLLASVGTVVTPEQWAKLEAAERAFKGLPVAPADSTPGSDDVVVPADDKPKAASKSRSKK